MLEVNVLKLTETTAQSSVIFSTKDVIVGMYNNNMGKPSVWVNTIWAFSTTLQLTLVLIMHVTIIACGSNTEDYPTYV